MAGILVPVVGEKRDGKEIFSISRAHVAYNVGFTVEDVTYGEWRWATVEETDGKALKEGRVQYTLLATLSLRRTFPQRQVDGTYKAMTSKVVWPLNKFYTKYRFVENGEVDYRLPAESDFGREMEANLFAWSDRLTAEEAIEKAKAFFEGKTLIRRVSDTIYTVSEHDWENGGWAINSSKRVSYFEEVKA